MKVVKGAAGRTTEWAATPARDRTSLMSISTSSSSNACSRLLHHSSSVSSWLFTIRLQSPVQLLSRQVAVHSECRGIVPGIHVIGGAGRDRHGQQIKPSKQAER